MGMFDTVILIALSGFVFYGFFFGLIRTVGSIAGVIAGFFVASSYYMTAYAWGSNLFFGYEKVGKVVCFLLLFSIANRLIGFAFALLDSALGIISIIPFVKTINRLLGAALGLAEGGLSIGLMFYYASHMGIASIIVTKVIADSKILPSLMKFSEIVLPFLPGLIERAKTFV